MESARPAGPTLEVGRCPGTLGDGTLDRHGENDPAGGAQNLAGEPALQDNLQSREQPNVEISGSLRHHKKLIFCYFQCNFLPAFFSFQVRERSRKTNTCVIRLACLDVPRPAGSSSTSTSPDPDRVLGPWRLGIDGKQKGEDWSGRLSV